MMKLFWLKHFQVSVWVVVISILVFLFFSIVWMRFVLGAEVSNRSDHISNSAVSATSNHELIFEIQDDVASGETITINFPDFSGIGSIDCGDVDIASSTDFGFNSAAHLSSCSPTVTAWGFAASGNTLTFTAPSAPGVYAVTGTVLTVQIGSNATFQEQGNEWITNSAVAGTKFVNISGSFQQTLITSGIVVSIGSGIAITVTISGPSPTPTPVPSPTPGPGGGGGGGALPPAGETSMVLEGKAYPKAFITALKNGQVVATLSTLNDGNFNIKLRGIQPGIYTFGVFAEDQKGRKSLTLSFTLNVLKNLTTTVSGIFIPPTITTNRDIFYPSEVLEVDGYAFPKSNVSVVLNSSHEIVESVSSDADGVWLLSYTLSELGIGDHSTRAKAQAPDGDQSTFSETRLFRIVPEGTLISPTPAVPACQGADLNFDGKVNLTDFSIMLFWWQSQNSQHPCVDINKDGVVNLVDFSIMMFQWTR